LDAGRSSRSASAKFRENSFQDSIFPRKIPRNLVSLQGSIFPRKITRNLVSFQDSIFPREIPRNLVSFQDSIFSRKIPRNLVSGSQFSSENSRGYSVQICPGIRFYCGKFTGIFRGKFILILFSLEIPWKRKFPANSFHFHSSLRRCQLYTYSIMRNNSSTVKLTSHTYLAFFFSPANQY
jgi:hypothetical protein